MDRVNLPPATSRTDPAITAGSVRLAVAVDDWFTARLPRKDSPHTLRAYRADIDVITGHLSATTRIPAPELTVADVAALPTLRAAFAAYAPTHAKASIRRAWSTWSGLFDHLVIDGVIPGNPMPGVARPRADDRDPKPFDESDTRRLLTFLHGLPRYGRDPWPERDLAIIATLLVTGARRDEALTLDARDVTGSLGEKRVRLRGKGGKDRAIPISGPLLELLDSYAATRLTRFPRHARKATSEPSLSGLDRVAPTQPLFVDRAGERLKTGGLAYLVHAAYRQAGIDGSRPAGVLVHALRHTFATDLIASGASAVALMDMLGHRSLSTTQRYVKATGREARAVAEANRSYDLLTAPTGVRVPG